MSIQPTIFGLINALLLPTTSIECVGIIFGCAVMLFTLVSLTFDGYFSLSLLSLLSLSRFSGVVFLNILNSHLINFHFTGVVVYFPLKESIAQRLPLASATTLLMEQVRLLMKTHAFVRENVPVSLAYYKAKKKDERSDKKTQNDDISGPCPDFSRYLYFMFAPTLVYRNRYPRYLVL